VDNRFFGRTATLVASWFPTFFQETRDVSVENSGHLQALILGATLVGSLLGGLVVDGIWIRTGDLRLSRGGVGATVRFVRGIRWSLEKDFQQ